MSSSQGPSCGSLQEITGKGQCKPLWTEQSWESGPRQAGKLAGIALPCCSPSVWVEDTAMKCK